MSDDFPPFPPPNQRPKANPNQGMNDWAQPADNRPPRPGMFEVEVASEEEVQRTVLFYRLYAGALIVVYMMIIAAFVGLSVTTEDSELIFQTIIMTPLLLGFSVFQAITMWMPRKKWAWVSGMVILGFGISSCCLPLALPLFMRWSKRDFKAAFGA